MAKSKMRDFFAWNDPGRYVTCDSKCYQRFAVTAGSRVVTDTNQTRMANMDV